MKAMPEFIFGRGIYVTGKMHLRPIGLLYPATPSHSPGVFELEIYRHEWGTTMGALRL